MLHKWKTTRVLAKHFDFRIQGGPMGEPARLLDKMYSDKPDFKQYSPVMAAATYLINYGVCSQDSGLGQHLDTVFPRLLAQGHMNPYQLEILMEYGDELSAQLSQQDEGER